MTGACEPTLIDTVAKLGFAVIGALVGASVAAYASRLKLRRLEPAIERRIRSAASACASAYSASDASACLPQLDSAVQFAQDVIASGYCPIRWQAQIGRLEDLRQAAAAISGLAPDLAPAALGRLRKKAEALVT